MPQGSNLKSINNTTGNESEKPQPRYMKLQKMSSKETPWVEKTVDPVNHNLRLARVTDLLRTVVDHQPGKKTHCLNLHYKLKVWLYSLHP